MSERTEWALHCSRLRTRAQPPSHPARTLLLALRLAGCATPFDNLPQNRAITAQFVETSQLALHAPYGPLNEADAVRVRRMLFLIVDAGRPPVGAERGGRPHEGWAIGATASCAFAAGSRWFRCDTCPQDGPGGATTYASSSAGWRDAPLANAELREYLAERQSGS